MDKKYYDKAESHKDFISECRELVKKSSSLSERLDRKIQLLSGKIDKKKLH
ncbi:hypothetical protein ACPV3O_23705 [Vibrio rotiferianus]|uniref:hypothetical protein n=1 Tax=Vibrio rotiferianus TaxID=190895 RepID=UPI00406A8B8E